MKFMRRLNRMVSANMHDLLDRCEDPERALRHSVREMEESLHIALERAAKVIAQEKLLTRDRDQHQSRAAEAQQRAEASVKANDIVAAKSHLQAKRLHDTAATSLTQQLAETKALSTKLRLRISSMKHKLQLARTQVTVLGARQQATIAQRTLLREVGALEDATDCLSRFDELSRRILEAEAETEALAELTGTSQQDEASFETDFDAEVEAIKNKLATPSY